MKSPISLRRFLSLQFATVAALPVAIIALIAWQLLMPRMRIDISVQHQAVARAIAGQISSHLLGGQRQLEALADLLAAGEQYSPAQLNSLLDANCGDGDLFETIYTVRRGENVIHSVGLARLRRAKRNDLLGLDLSGRSFLNQAGLTAKAAWSETFLSTVSSHLAVALIIPLSERVLIGEITLDRMSDFISHLPMEAGLYTLVLDQQGCIVADSLRLRGGQYLNLATIPVSNDHGDTVRPSGSFKIDGIPQVGTVVEVEQVGWKVLVAQPLQSAFKSVRDTFAAIVSGLIMALAIALGLAWQRSNSLSRIFRFYAQQAQAISRGEYDLPWPPSKTIEFKHLAANLQSMARTISEREAQLKTSEKRLNDLVANVPGVVFQFRSTLDHEYAIDFLSEKTSSILGLKVDSATFMREFFAGIPDDEKSEFDRSIQAAVKSGLSWNYEGRFIKPDGETIWISGNAVPQREDDRMVFYGVLMDITWRRQLEASLRVTQFCFDMASIGILQVDEEGRFMDANAQACRTLGYSSEEMRRLSVFDINPLFKPEGWPAHLANLRRQRKLIFETQHRHKNGEIFPVQIMANLMTFEGREIHVAFIQDISERKRWEQELADSERRYRNLFDRAPMMYVVTDNRSNAPMIKDVNHMFTQVLGYRREEILNTPLGDYYSEESRLELISRGGYQRALNGRFVTAERDLVTRDGRTVHTLVHSLPEHDAKGNVIGTRAMFLDITERKHAVEALQRLRNYLSNIIDSMPSLLVGVDSDVRVTQWNKQAELTTGLSFKKAVSQPLHSVLPGLAVEMDGIGKAIRNREVIRKSKIPRHSQGQTRFEDVTIFPLITNGVDGAVIRVDDVTERVRLEEMMIQSEKMLSVGGLAAGMAHEINNPLAGILQNAAVVESRLLGDLPANRKAAEAAGTTLAAVRHYMALRNLPDMLENIRASGNRAATIVRNMLSFARKSERVVSSNDLGALLDQTVELAQTDYDMKKRYDFKQIELVREYDRTAPPIPCEASKLQQVFLNILKNGAEAMAEKNDADRRPRFILRLKDDGDWVGVEIEDNGPGMDEATRRRIFEPFFTTKPTGKGTGLGLSVSYFIISEDHGGDMVVQAAEGGGTRFVIRLPKRGKRVP